MESHSSINGNSNNTDVRMRAEEKIAGNHAALEALRELIIFPLLFSHDAKHLGHRWPQGLILYGPPGTGKTSLVRAVVQECGAHLTAISQFDVNKPHAGENERFLREAFAAAASQATLSRPSVIFIDEIDTLCPRRDTRREQDVRVASQVLMLMDSNRLSSASTGHVVVVAATNRIHAIDPALRRSGRFHTEIEVTVPTEMERLEILNLYTKRLPMHPAVNMREIAASCNGYVGADLEALSRAAFDSAKESLSKHEDGEFASIIITMEDWKHARSVVGPSITRGVTVDVPKVSWEDIGGLKELKEKLKLAVEWPIKHAAAIERLGILQYRGVLLYGPPGCSKTTLAKAAANASKASFFSFSCAELFSMYVGEGEALLRDAFQKARLAAPSILFIDEVDAIACKRGENSGNSSTVAERLLTTLLAEMDGLEQARGVLVLAATNRPRTIDAALIRPGRFDLVCYVPPPDLEARYEILRVHTRKKTLANDVDLRKIAKETELFTGAELMGLCNEAGIAALREDISATVIYDRHFRAVKDSLKPSLTRAQLDEYKSFMKQPLKTPQETRPNLHLNSVSKINYFSRQFFAKSGIASALLILGSSFLFMHMKSKIQDLTAT